MGVPAAAAAATHRDNYRAGVITSAEMPADQTMQLAMQSQLLEQKPAG